MTTKRFLNAALAMTAVVAFCGVASGCGSDGSATTSEAGSATSGTASSTTSDDTVALQKAEASWETGTPPARKEAFAPADNSKKVKIAYFVSATANPFWAKTTAAVKEVAEARNASVQVFDAGFDPAKQQSQMQDALTSGRYDAFVVIPVANTNLIPTVAQAKAKNVPVIVTGDFPIGPKNDTVEPQVPGVSAVAMANPATIQHAVMDGVSEACKTLAPEPCNIAQISGGFKLPIEAFIYKLLQDTVAEIPNAKIVAREEGGYLLDPARSAMQNILTAHRDVNLLVTSSDAMATGAANAIKQAGKQDQVKIVSEAASQEGIAFVRDGSWYMTALQLPYDDGLYAGNVALRLARGQDVDSVVDVLEKSGIDPALTKSVLDKYPDFTGQWRNG